MRKCCSARRLHGEIQDPGKALQPQGVARKGRKNPTLTGRMQDRLPHYFDTPAFTSGNAPRMMPARRSPGVANTSIDSSTFSVVSNQQNWPWEYELGSGFCVDGPDSTPLSSGLAPYQNMRFIPKSWPCPCLPIPEVESLEPDISMHTLEDGEGLRHCDVGAIGRKHAVLPTNRGALPNGSTSRFVRRWNTAKL